MTDQQNVECSSEESAHSAKGLDLFSDEPDELPSDAIVAVESPAKTRTASTDQEMEASVLCLPVGTRSARGFDSRTHFMCRACQQVLPLVYMSQSQPNRCTKDVASYKALADRWIKNRQLKLLWNSWNDEQRAQWYRKQHSLNAYKKRSFDDFVYEEELVQGTANVERDLRVVRAEIPLPLQ